MEMYTFVLNGLNSSLTLIPDQLQWCQVVLSQDNKNFLLGAQTLKYIVLHLIAFLSEHTVNQRWVFSLSELHVSVYGEYIKDKVVFQFQNADGKMFAQMEITSTQRDQWLQLLQKHSIS